MPPHRSNNDTIRRRLDRLLTRRQGGTSRPRQSRSPPSISPSPAPVRRRPRNTRGFSLASMLPLDRAACPDAASNTEAELYRKFGDNLPCDVGAMSDLCVSCGALHWKGERTGNDNSTLSASFSTCCKKGKIILPVHYDEIDYPSFLKALLMGTDTSESRDSFPVPCQPESNPAPVLRILSPLQGL